MGEFFSFDLEQIKKKKLVSADAKSSVDRENRQTRKLWYHYITVINWGNITCSFAANQWTAEMK